MPRVRNRASKGKTRSRHRRVSRRVISCQSLEPRRLLVAEGDVFSLSGTFDAAGVVGDVSAEIRWGDGTTSPAETVSGGNTTGNLRIRFDYSLDTGNFFADPARRARLQAAGDALIARFGDTLAAINPGGILEWEPAVFHPSIGQPNQLAGTLTALPKNLPVPANEIIIYAGARDLPGANRAVGGPSSFSFPATQVTCTVQADCDRQLAEIEAFRNVVRARGQPGALASPQTDVSPQVGSVGFDTNTNWYFGTNPNGITSGQIDFASAATHEIAHVLGFGITRSDVVTSWQRLSGSGRFTGTSATAAYQGSGNPTIAGGHWSQTTVNDSDQRPLMATEILTGRVVPFSTLDFAAMDDLGWDLLNAGTAVTGSHRFPDDGQFPVDVVLSGSRGGQIVYRTNNVDVTNVAPTLTVAADQTASAGLPITITDIAQLTDPGYSNNLTNPPTFESFDFSIDWGDGSPSDQGTATIDANGDANGGLTLASFDGTHTYQTAGPKTVTIRIRDDDAGSAEGTLTINVSQPPALTLSLDNTQIDEDAGNNAATLMVQRGGSDFSAAVTVNLESDDPSEATLPSSVVIPAGQSAATVPVAAVDDALLDGDITVTLSSSAAGLASDEIDLLVRDRESLSATFLSDQISEDATASVDLVIRRSNIDDLASELVVAISDAGAGELTVPSSVTIPAGQSEATVLVTPIDDDDPERPMTFTYSATAAGYQDGQASIELIDDEPPLFQNVRSRFDVNDNGDVTTGDALRVINEMTRRGGASDLDPESEQPDGTFVDVNGDYRVSALDALQVINEVTRNLNSGNSEEVGLVTQFDVASRNDRDFLQWRINATVESSQF